MQLKAASYTDGIKKVLNNFVEGWNMHDVKIFSQVFAEDADFTNVKGVSRQGRAAIEELHKPLFKTIWAHSTLVITKSMIRLIRPDVAAVDAWWTLDGLKTTNGADHPSRHGILSFIMTEHLNIWMINVMHNMELPESQSQKC